MKIDRLDLRAYGCFEKRDLDFATHHGKLVLIVGDNEAGKSTILSAISHWFFGFDHSMGSESYQFGKEVLVGGTLSQPNGSLQSIRKRGKNSLLKGDLKTPLPVDALKPYLGDLTRERYEGLFGLNHERLCAAADEIAAGTGDIGGSLFTAASGLQSLSVMRKTIESNREILFKSGGSKPPINAAIREFKEALEKTKSEATSAKDTDELRRKIETATEMSRAAQSEIRLIKAELKTLERAKAARPLFEQRREIHAKLAPLQSLPELRDGFEHDWRNLPVELAGQQQLASKFAKDIARVEGEIADLPADDVILTIAEAIQTASAKAKDISTLKMQVLEDQQKIRDSGGEAKQRLRALDLDPNRLTECEADLRISEINAGRISKLIKAESALLTAVDNATQAVARLKRQQETLENKLQEIPPTEQRQRLSELVSDVHTSGDPVAIVADLDVHIAAETQILVDELARLGFQQDWRTAPALTVPNLESIRHHRSRRTEADAALDEWRRALRRHREELRKIEASLRELEQSGPVPLFTEWSQARDVRDSTWQIIRGVWLDHASASTTPERLASDLERQTRTSDDVAEALYRAASRVGQKAAKTDEAQTTNQACADCETELAAAEVEFNRWQSEWLNLWTGSGITVHAPADMLQWRNNWDVACAKVRQLDEAIKLRQRMEEKRKQFVAAVSEELTDETLPAEHAAERAITRLDELQSLEGKRTQLAADFVKAGEDLFDANATLIEKQSAYTEWQRQWQEAVAVIPLPEAVEFDPSRAEDVLKNIELFREQISDRRKWQVEIDRRQKLIVDWTAAVQSIADQLGERASLDAATHPQVLVSLWNGRTSTARKKADSRVTKEERLKELHGEAEKIAAEIVILTTRLARLSDEAGVENDADIPGRLDDVRRRRRLQNELETQCVEPLRRLDADEILEQLASQGLENLQQRIDELTDSESLATERRLEQEKAKTAAETELKALESREGGFAARAAQETVLTRLRRLLPEYAVAVLGNAVLDRAVQSYRNRNASSLIERAGEYFCTLTCGSFTGLDLDDATLVCVRPEGKRPRKLPTGRGQGLSDGSYDQLFLALRLAFLQDQVVRNGPVPIIFDDILLAFDDRRATAAFECLVRMAAQTQVLLFTHHQHLGDLAKASPLADKIAVVNIS